MFNFFKNLGLENPNISLTKDVLFYGKNTDYNVMKLATAIFKRALQKSNKRISFEEISKKNSNLDLFVKLEFAANFNALKNTITNFSNRKYPIPDSQVQKTAENTFEMLVNNTVQEINNI
jgi:hypothetical protein